MRLTAGEGRGIYPKFLISAMSSMGDINWGRFDAVYARKIARGRVVPAGRTL